MDYRYIEQLIGRDWSAETSAAEEAILRLFFSQTDVPAHLLPYKALFAYEASAAAEGLDEAFDERVLSAAEAAAPQAVSAVRLQRSRFAVLRPLYQAAASVAIIVLLGIGAERSFNAESDYDLAAPAAYNEAYGGPQQNYRVLTEGQEKYQHTAIAEADSLLPPAAEIVANQ